MKEQKKQQIMKLVMRQQFTQSRQLCENVCRKQPRDAEAWFLLGTLCGQLGDYLAAEKHFERSAGLRGQVAMTWYNLGIAQLRLGKNSQACDSLERTVSLKPGFTQAWVMLGRLHTSQGRIEDACSAYDHALALQPGMPEAISGFAEAYERAGDLEKAMATLQPLLTQNLIPASAAVVFGKIAIVLSRGQEAIDLINNILRLSYATTEEIQELNYCLGNLHDSRHEYDRAFAAYRAANHLLQQPWNRAAYTAFIERLAGVFNTDTLATMTRAGVTSDRPVFIVGMPRSGTTLVEQILASHPMVCGGGELKGIGDLVTAIPGHCDGQPYPDACNHINGNTLDTMANDYLAQLDRLSASAPRVTDKMPQNFLHLGIIDQLFPNARVIHCRRSPLDTCLSIYTHNFNATHAYSSDLTSLGHYYRGYENLMRHWTATLRLPLLEVSYETLVSDTEATIRAMVEFCGLPWDDHCLRFHETSRQVETLSYDQVRKPMYRTSVDCWKNYEDHLGPLMEALDFDMHG